MRIIRKKTIENKENVKTIQLTNVKYKHQYDAVKHLHELYKIDRGLYRTYINNHMSEINNCDDGYAYGVGYYFTVDNVTVEACIEDAIVKSELLFGEQYETQKEIRI